MARWLPAFPGWPISIENAVHTHPLDFVSGQSHDTQEGIPVIPLSCLLSSCGQLIHVVPHFSFDFFHQSSNLCLVRVTLVKSINPSSSRAPARSDSPSEGVGFSPLHSKTKCSIDSSCISTQLVQIPSTPRYFDR